MTKRAKLEHLIWMLVSDTKRSVLNTPTFVKQLSAQEIWKQKVFCILSSRFSAHRAATISERFLDAVPVFNYSLSFARLQDACFEFLRSPSIGYRFPRTRAEQISLAWFPFAQIKDQYHEYVQSFETEEAARRDIVTVFPGMGLKQASMFLRNIGASESLAVIDVHLLEFLEICHGRKVDQLTPRRYLEAEGILRREASNYDMSLNAFDPIVWAAVKALKNQYAHV